MIKKKKIKTNLKKINKNKNNQNNEINILEITKYFFPLKYLYILSHLDNI